MKPEEFKERVLADLDRIEDAELHAAMPTTANAAMFDEIVDRFRHACAALPGITWDEFMKIGRARSAPRRGRGKPKADLRERAATPLSRAARDVDLIKGLWREMQPGTGAPPMSPIEIAAERHGVDEAALGEHVRRPNSRRPDRLIRRP